MSNRAFTKLELMITFLTMVTALLHLGTSKAQSLDNYFNATRNCE